MWLLVRVIYRTDGELRVCIPMSDALRGQADEGLTMLLDIEGEVTQRYLIMEMNR